MFSATRGLVEHVYRFRTSLRVLHGPAPVRVPSSLFATSSVEEDDEVSRLGSTSADGLARRASRHV